jgi:short-subunit dehydrogenase
MTMKNNNRKWVLIVGATAGIARALIREMARHGFDLILAARDESELEILAADARIRSKAKIAFTTFDVGQIVDAERDALFWQNVLQICEGDLHGVVLCHGVMPPQEQAQKNWKLSRAMIEVNYASFVSLLNIAADYFETRESGFIVGLGSVAGDRGRAGNYIYGSTKAALGVLLQGVRQRLAPKNVDVITIKPGPIDTAMTFGLQKLPLLVPPERAARDIVRAIRHKKPIAYTPAPWRVIMTLLCLVPESLWKRLKF